jgi:hypothetical protein
MGAFGDRFAKIAEVYAPPSPARRRMGRGGDPAEVRRAAAASPARAVLLTHSETSTGVPTIEALRQRRGGAPDALIPSTRSGAGAVPPRWTRGSTSS